MICLSETYLNSTIPNDDDKLQIPGYTLIRSDHPSNANAVESVYIVKALYRLELQILVLSVLSSRRKLFTKNPLF